MGFFLYYGKVNVRNVYFIFVREICFLIYCQLNGLRKIRNYYMNNILLNMLYKLIKNF